LIYFFIFQLPLFVLLAFSTQFQSTRKLKGGLIFILAGGCNQSLETR
jgi:hypothetical protein